jgi:hypothetical protein
MKLNIGCGRDLKEGWDNIDNNHLPGTIHVDLDYGFPDEFKDDTYDEMLASHVLEHIVAILPLMETLHRIAKPECKLTIRVPFGSSDDAFEDPTHVRQYFLKSFMYYSQPAYYRADYGYRGDWRVDHIVLKVPRAIAKGLTTAQEVLTLANQQRNVVREMVATLYAVKPIRAQKLELLDKPKVEIQIIE